MKSAWIGFSAAIIGALIGALVTPQYARWLEGPQEGLFSVDVSCIKLWEIPDELRNQIKSYPCSVRVAHIGGPPVTDLVVTIESKHELLSQVRSVRNDENVQPGLTNQGRTLKIKVPELRKQSVLEFSFDSTMPPSVKDSTVMSSGRLAGISPELQDHVWYKEQYIVVPGVIAGFLVAVLILAYLIRRLTSDRVEGIQTAQVQTYAAVAAALALNPVYPNLATIFVIYGIVVIHSEIRMVGGKSSKSPL